MGAKRAANNRSDGENKAQRWNGMHCCKIAGQSGDRIDQNEQGSNRGRLTNVRPTAK